MSFLDRLLEPPSYGYTRQGDLLYVPSAREILIEFFSRMNIFRTRKNWLPLFGWTTSLALSIPFFVFLFQYFSWPIAAIGFFYSMVVLGTHGTIYYHRYSTHRAFEFSSRLARFIVRNLVIKIVPEETYVISHYVHHKIPELPGDPYNVHAGWLYCFLADANHQLIRRDLSKSEFEKLRRFLDHTGVNLNTYAQYLKWGSLCHPGFTLLHYTMNWGFWYAVFFILGGHALATGLFGASFFWAMGVRTFNFSGHGSGKDKRREGVDFNRADLSINQLWPGLITGEWHNNHHLFPNGSRAGFRWYELDWAWVFIRFYYFLGGIRSYKDYKRDFMEKHYLPYRLKKSAPILLTTEISTA